MWKLYKTYLFVSITIFFQEVFSKTIYMIPAGAYQLDDELFEPQEGWLWNALRDECKKRGYRLTTRIRDYPKDAVAVIALNPPFLEEGWAMIKNDRAHKKILYLLEPPQIQCLMSGFYQPAVNKYFDVVFSLATDYVDGKHCRQFYYPPMFFKVGETGMEMLVPIPFNQRNFCTIIVGNKSSTDLHELYSKRLEVIKFFEKHDYTLLDFYGTGWPRGVYKSYKGPVGMPGVDNPSHNKLNVLRHYKFCICFENNASNGSITEKILHAFNVGCVPVYLGAPDITDYIPDNCFIDYRKFASNAEMLSYLQSITEDEFNQYLENIRAWFKSEIAQRFTFQYFANQMIDTIEE